MTILGAVPRVLRPLLLGALAALALLPCTAAAKVPTEFFGVMIDGPATETPGILELEAPRMRAYGVRTARFAIEWAKAQPYRTMADVPEAERARFTDIGGVPTDLSRSDRIMRLLGAAGLRPQPVVLYAPDWAAKFPGAIGEPRRYGSPPSDAAAYARFIATLAHRYGPYGSLWRDILPQHRRPVRAWQIWNEPNLNVFWNEPEFERGYAALLKATRPALEAADPSAKIVTAGLTNGGSAPAWTALRRLYAQGARGTFDVVALHPYTRNALGIRATIRATRKVMRARGDDRVQILLSEISFSSSGGDSPDARTFATWDTSERGQGDRLRSALRMAARERRTLRLAGVTWYTWLSPDVQRAPWPQYAGLNRLRDDRIVRKPALLSYRKTVRELSR